MERTPENADHESAAELALIAALRRSEPPAYETLVRLYGGRMLSVARRFLDHHEDAEDAVQEACLSAFKALGTFDGRSKLSTWLHRIVVNAALMKLRVQRRRSELPIDGLLPLFQEDGHQAQPPPRWKDVGHELLRSETQQLVRDQIAKLPDSYRTVLLLRDIEEFDTETVAQLLDVSQSVVKTRLHRARQALRSLLDPLFREEPPC